MSSGYQWQVDQRGQFGLGQRQGAALFFQLAGGLDQRALIAQGLDRVTDTLLAQALAVVAGLGDARHKAIDLGQQTIRGHRAPISGAHVLDDGMYHLASAFLHDQALVALLLGADVVSPGIAGGQCHAWQHVEGGQVDLALGHGFLHDLQACLEVVLHRAGHGVLQGQWAAERFLILEHDRQSLLRALLGDAAVEAHQNIVLVEVLTIAERHLDDAARQLTGQYGLVVRAQHPAHLALAGLRGDRGQ